MYIINYHRNIIDHKTYGKIIGIMKHETYLVHERLIHLPYHLGVDTETLLLKIEVLILMDMKTKTGS